MTIQNNPIRDALTPEALGLIDAVHRAGSMAAAARELGVVPSALTYRIRQVEDALDVLLFDRSSRRARLTEAGKELLREGNRENAQQITFKRVSCLSWVERCGKGLGGCSE